MLLREEESLSFSGVTLITSITLKSSWPTQTELNFFKSQTETDRHTDRQRRRERGTEKERIWNWVDKEVREDLGRDQSKCII